MNALRKNKPNPKWVGVEWREEAEAEERAKQQAEHARQAAIARQPSKIVRRFLRRWQEFIKTGFEKGGAMSGWVAAREHPAQNDGSCYW